jgi:hypothetical protein
MQCFSRSKFSIYNCNVKSIQRPIDNFRTDNIQEHEVSEQHKAATNFAERPEAEVKKSEGARCVHM